MRFYRVHMYDNDGSHGYEWYTSQKAAKKAANKFEGRGAERPEVEEVWVEPTKKGILRALIVYATHPDNG